MIKPNELILYLSLLLIILLTLVLIIHIGASWTGTESNGYYYHLNSTVKIIGGIRLTWNLEVVLIFLKKMNL